MSIKFTKPKIYNNVRKCPEKLKYNSTVVFSLKISTDQYYASISIVCTNVCTLKLGWSEKKDIIETKISVCLFQLQVTTHL